MAVSRVRDNTSKNYKPVAGRGIHIGLPQLGSNIDELQITSRVTGTYRDKQVDSSIKALLD